MVAQHPQQVAAPLQVPAAYAALVETLHKDARLILDSFSVPFIIQAQLAKDGYIRLTDLADRWEDSKTARCEAPDELGFKLGESNFDGKSSKFASMRLAQSIDRAKASTSQSWQTPFTSSPTNRTGAISPMLTELGPGVRPAPRALETTDW